MSGIPTSPLLTTEEAAGYLRVTVRSLEEWRSKRYGPPFARLGRRVMYRLRELDAWIEGQVVAQERPPQLRSVAR